MREKKHHEILDWVFGSLSRARKLGLHVELEWGRFPIPTSDPDCPFITSDPKHILWILGKNFRADKEKDRNALSCFLLHREMNGKKKTPKPS